VTGYPPPPPEPRPEPRPEPAPDARPGDEFLPGPDHYPRTWPAGVAVLAPAPRPRLWWATRADLRSGLLVVGVLAVLGLLLGVLWYALAPRLGLRVDQSGNLVALGPSDESEALVGADALFFFMTAAGGLVAGGAAWMWRSARGPVAVVALAAGCLLGAFLTSWVGHLLGHGPSAAELREVGRVVHVPLRLRAKSALAFEPLFAVAAYVVGALFAGEDDLGRPDRRPTAAAS
jgi:Protein of unknown function (DUF2567)